ncbi:hypothetical protein Q75_09140 [Bacillus coahuilensis p1.1.43]|uniref:Uncharacterized protein n=1 Tax=Bacillus coahuilensis p1.1.43 TaxID=1150625 RepID=A0A147K807_9BACI|nr:DUF6526 family protein [Bacillus coahuilensis]KUP06293.1 hypothetical protein Q75_09140 [Bacillus coahuilensis p1.1.43]
MKTQNYHNHTKIDPIFHGVIGGLALVTLGFSIGFAVNNLEDSVVLSIFVLVVTITLILTGLNVRRYALMLQDRIIRQEESFRYFRLTGKELNKAVTLKQIIALRFASDEELPTLVDRAVNENVSADEIKKSIRNWRADHHRV